MHGVRQSAGALGKETSYRKRETNRGEVGGGEGNVLPAWKQPCDDGDGTEGRCPVILRGNTADVRGWPRGKSQPSFLTTG